MDKDLKMVEFTIDDNDENSNCYTISLVENPAIEKDFQFFDKINPPQYFINEEKMEILGAVMIPDMPILRKKENGEYYNCWFSKETVKKIAYKFQKQKNTNNFSVKHNGKLVDGVYLAETWIVDEDECKKYGVNNGTWYSVTKCENRDVWQLVKDKYVKGFSVELQNLLVDENYEKVDIINKEDKILNLMKYYIDKQNII